MFEFAWPWLGLLLPLPWLLRRFWPKSDSELDPNQDVALIHPHLNHLQSAYLAGGRVLSAAERLPMLLLWLLWLLLLLALMQPRWIERYDEVQSEGYDLMLAVDLSRSMLALDFTLKGQPVNRLQVVKGVVGRFIEQRKGDRIGLVLFGDGAYVQAPLTLDGQAVKSMLDNSLPRMAGDATAIGDAIALAVKKLRERPANSRVLILLTDGENTAGNLPPEQASLLANEYGVRIYAVGVGSTGEVPFPDANGQIHMERMEIDEDLLTGIATRTGGAYFRATDTKALEQIYQRIDELEKTQAKTQSLWIPKPLYQIPLGMALLVMLALLGLGLGRGRLYL